MKQLLFLLVPLCLFAATGAQAEVDIENDKNDCISGWLSMDVTVKVEDELFQFSPSCNFSYDITLTTSKGETCQIHAGMCSAFSPKNRFEVACEHSGSASINVLCAPEVN